MTFVICWYSLQTVWTQIRTNKMSVLIRIQTVWYSHSVPERFFWIKPSDNNKSINNYQACKLNMSQCMRFPTMWYVGPAKPQSSLCIRAVWSEPLLVAWVFYDCKATDCTPFGASKLKRRLQRLVRVYTCQNVKLLEISCCCSIIIIVNVWHWKHMDHSMK